MKTRPTGSLLRRVGFLVLAASAAAAAGRASTLTMPLREVRPGMTGKARSVFAGTAAEDSDVEILGVLANYQPGRNLILARLKGKVVDQAGIIQGMSGSPVFLDGKVAGAVAYSFAYAKEAIAGITPIEEMLAIGDRATPREAPSLSVPVSGRPRFEETVLPGLDALAADGVIQAGGWTARRLKLPLVLGGLVPRSIEKARPLLERMGFLAVPGGSSGQARDMTLAADVALREGDAVGVQLVGGDADVSAVGTVTYVDGKRVLAFGHPFYNLGAVDFAMTKARVIAVVPSLESSFKLAQTEALVGVFSQDRSAGALGELGRMPRLIPVNLRLEPEGRPAREFKLKFASDKILGPAFLNLTLSSLLTGEERSYGDLTLDFEADVFLDNGMGVHLEDLFSGNLDNAATDVSGLVAAVVYLLSNNEFKDLGIHRIDLAVRPSDRLRQAVLERVWLDKYEVAPGERIQIKVFVRGFKEESVVHEVQVQAPALPAGSEFQIVVGDADAMQAVESTQYKTREFVPRSLGQLVRLLNSLRKNNRIYFKILASKPGLFLRGEEMSNLPPSLKAMFASPRAAASAPTELARSTLSEYQLPLPFVFKGAAAIPVQIRR
jgi:hypothetical protein